MAKTKISEFSSTAGNNTDIDSINIAEGCAPSGINNAIRELMAQLKDFQTGAAGDSFNGPVGTTTAAAGAFTTLSASGTTTLSGLTASTALALDASKNVVSVTNTGTGNNVLATSPTLVTPILGTPTSVTLTNATGLPISTGVSGLGTGIATALAVNVGSAGAPVINGGALGTPSSGTVTNLTGTASININGTVGATTANTGAFTTLTTSSTVTHNGGTANGVAYLNGSKVLTTGSALTFNGTTLSIGNASVANGKAFFQNATNDAYGVIGTIGGADFRIESTYGSTAGYKPITFYTNGSEQMRLTSTGLGIGTSSPGEKLNVVGGGSTSSTVNFTGGSNNDNATIASDYSLIFQVDANNNVGGRDFNWRVGGKGYSDGTSLMVLDSSGNLGLGVTPSAWSSAFKALQLSSTSITNNGSNDSFFGANYFFDGSNNRYINSDFAATYGQVNGQHLWYTAPSGTAGDAISFTQAMTLHASGGLSIGSTGDPGVGSLVLDGGSGAGRVTLAAVSGYNGILSTTTGFAAWRALQFFTKSGDASATIDTIGNLLVGTTSNELNSTDYGIALRTPSGGQQIRINTSGATDTNIAVFRVSGSDVFRVATNGGIANFSANDVNLSDRREKTNFAPAGDYLPKICAIPVQTYNYINQNIETDPGLTLGVVAQDVQSVAPELVMESNWGTEEEPKMRLSIYQTDLQYALMKCIQEQQTIIESLKARLDAANL